MASDPTPSALLQELEASLGRAGAIQAELQHAVQEAEARSRTLSPEELQAFATLQTAVARIGRAQNGRASGSAAAIDDLGAFIGGSAQRVPPVRDRLVSLDAIAASNGPGAATPQTPPVAPPPSPQAPAMAPSAPQVAGAPAATPVLTQVPGAAAATPVLTQVPTATPVASAAMPTAPPAPAPTPVVARSPAPTLTTPQAAPAAPAAPRTFILGQPRMTGDDVARFQRLLNQRYRAWGSSAHVSESGVYDPATRKAALAVALRLGVDPAHLKSGMTPALRLLIKHPSRRTPQQLARAKRRRKAAPAAKATKTGLAAAISAAGGRYEDAIIREAGRTKLPVSLVCAVIEQETNFRNVFGHDKVSNPVKSPPRGLLAVTHERYTQYLGHRRAGRGCQGVGPMQLTSPGLQDQADKLGGCWQPGANIRVGCDYLADLIKAHGKKAGIQAYNGAPGFGYATSVLALEQKWHKRLAGAKPPRPEPTKPGHRAAAAPRTFRLTTPNAMEGSDVKAFQRLLNARFDAWKIDIHVSEDGEYGADTRHAAQQIARGLGIAPGDYAQGFTPQVRSVMRTSSRRTPDQRKRAAANRAWVQRLRKHHAATGSLRVRAYKEARRLRDMGVREVGGNNRGDMVSKIIRANNGPGPEPWCGDFVAWCYRKAGSKSVNRQWASVRAYLPMTGLKRTKTPLQGDIVRFTFDHVALFGGWCDSSGKAVAPGAATHIRTIEGNTGSSGAVSDSKRGGDGVYMKLRARSLVSDFIHVAR